MKKIKIYLFVFITASLFSCSGEKQEEIEDTDSPKNAIGAMVKMSTEIQKAAENHQKQIESGDSVVVLHYEELYAFFPDKISGYTKGEPTGGTINMQGMSYSSAEVNYENDKGDNVKIAILDYSAAFSLYSMATAMWGMNMSIDTPTEKAKSIKINDKYTGWESFKKKDKSATLVIGVGDRFLVNVDADNQENLDWVKEIASKINLDKLAGV